jgi:hypothetical protein
MARLEDLRPAFGPLKWPEKILFIIDYRTKRYNDLNTVQEFDLKKAAKTKSTKVREKKEPSVRKRTAKEMLTLSPEQLSLLKQLGIA